MEERIESQSVYNGKLFQVFKDRVRLPNGNATTREIVRHPGSVAIVPRHKDGRVVLVRQYRYVTGRELWEIPAGTLDKPGEGIAEGARRELAEEARLSAGKWTTLGSAYLMPGYCDERMTFYLAEDLSPTEGHAQIDGKPVHRGEGHLCLHFLHVITRWLHAGDLATLAVEIADDVAHVALGHQDLDVHDGFEQHRLGVHHRLAHGHGARQLEGDVLPVHRVG